MTDVLVVLYYIHTHGPKKYIYIIVGVYMCSEKLLKDLLKRIVYGLSMFGIYIDDSISYTDVSENLQLWRWRPVE